MIEQSLRFVAHLFLCAGRQEFRSSGMAAADVFFLLIFDFQICTPLLVEVGHTWTGESVDNEWQPCFGRLREALTPS